MTFKRAVEGSLGGGDEVCAYNHTRPRHPHFVPTPHHPSPSPNVPHPWSYPQVARFQSYLFGATPYKRYFYSIEDNTRYD